MNFTIQADSNEKAYWSKTDTHRSHRDKQEEKTKLGELGKQEDTIKTFPETFLTVFTYFRTKTPFVVNLT